MSNDSIIELPEAGKFEDALTGILRDGACRLLHTAVEAEPGGIRSGHQPERDVQTGIGPVPVWIPKVRSNDGKPVTFRQSVVPPYLRKSRTLEGWVPWLPSWQVSESHAEADRGREELTGFFDFPVGDWQSIRTTNLIESALATIRHRTRANRGCLNRNTMLCMMSRLGQCAETRWRKLHGYRQLAPAMLDFCSETAFWGSPYRIPTSIHCGVEG